MGVVIKIEYTCDYCHNRLTERTEAALYTNAYAELPEGWHEHLAEDAVFCSHECAEKYQKIILGDKK